MWAIFFQFFKYKKIGQKFPKKREKLLKFTQGGKKKYPKNDKIFQQQITSSHHQSFLWHFHYYFVPVKSFA
jgi:hypothetical protein